MAESSFRSRHILLVDDTPTNLAVARKLLEKMGHTVQTAANGQEAIDVYSNQSEAF